MLLMMDSVGRSLRKSTALQAAVCAKLSADPLDLRLTASQCCSARMDRVVAEHQVVRMLDCGPENERRLALCLELDRLLGLCEYGEFARADRLACEQATLVDSKPGNAVSRRRHVAPTLAILEPNVEVVDPRRCTDDAARASILPEHDARRSFAWHMLGSHILALGG